MSLLGALKWIVPRRSGCYRVLSRDPAPAVRMAALQALRTMRRDDRTALPKVQEVVNDPSEDARQMAQKPVTQPTLLKRPRDAVAHCSPGSRARAVHQDHLRLGLGHGPAGSADQGRSFRRQPWTVRTATPVLRPNRQSDHGKLPRLPILRPVIGMSPLWWQNGRIRTSKTQVAGNCSRSSFRWWAVDSSSPVERPGRRAFGDAPRPGGLRSRVVTRFKSGLSTASFLGTFVPEGARGCCYPIQERAFHGLAHGLPRWPGGCGWTTMTSPANATGFTSIAAMQGSTT